MCKLHTIPLGLERLDPAAVCQRQGATTFYICLVSVTETVFKKKCSTQNCDSFQLWSTSHCHTPDQFNFEQDSYTYQSLLAAWQLRRG